MQFDVAEDTTGRVPGRPAKRCRYLYWDGSQPPPPIEEQERRRQQDFWRRHSEALAAAQRAALRTSAKLVRGGAPTDDGADGPVCQSDRYYAPRQAAKQRDPHVGRQKLAPRFLPRGKKRRRFDSLAGPERVRYDPLPFVEEERGGSSDSDGSCGHQKLVCESAEESERRRESELAEQAMRSGTPAGWERWALKLHRGGVQRRSLCERRLDVYDRALDRFPSSPVLWRGMAACAAEHLPLTAAEDVWDTALRRVPGSHQLWVDFLAWKRAQLSTFSYSEQRKLLSRAVRRLSAVKHCILADTGTTHEHKARSLWDLEGGVVRLIGEAAAFEAACGYTERAVALFQAVLEVNCFAPRGQDPWRTKLEDFEDFWCEERPRIGESGWAPWSEAAAHPRPPPSAQPAPPPPPADTAEAELDEADVGRVRDASTYAEWIRLQQERDAAALLPVSAIRDPGAARADPDRVVLIDDIDGAIAPVYEPGNIHTLFQLLLEQLGVPVLFTQRAITDSMVTDVMAGYADPERLVEVFACDSWCEVLDWRPVRVGGRMEVVRNVLAAASKVFPDDPLFPLLRLEVEASADPKRAMALAKERLAVRRSDTRLWGFFAGLQRRIGQHKGAEKVLEVLLTDGMRAHDAATRAGLVPSLCRQLAELVALGPGEPETVRSRVQHVCCCAAEGVYVKGAGCGDERLAKARSSFQARSAALLQAAHAASGEARGSVLVACMEVGLCHSLLELSSGLFPAAVSVMRQVCDALRTADDTGADVRMQYFWMMFARLVHLPSALGVAAEPCAVCAVLREAASAFPQHPQLVALYVQRALRIPGGAHSVRRFFDQALAATQHSPLVAVYAIHAERTLLPRARARTRRVIAESLQTPQCRRCEMLWRVVMAFERDEAVAAGFVWEKVAMDRKELADAFNEGTRLGITHRMERRLAQKEKGLHRAKRVYYQAIAEVPASVGLWVEGLRLLAPVLEPAEIQDVVDLMLDKELHLRAFVEEL